MLKGSFPPWLNTALPSITSHIPITLDSLVTFQGQVPDTETKSWEKERFVKDSDGLWKCVDDRVALPKLAYSPLISFVHGVTYASYKRVTDYIS